MLFKKRNMKRKSIWQYIFQQVVLIFFCKGKDKPKKILSKQVERHKENIKEQTRHRWSIQNPSNGSRGRKEKTENR